MLRHFITSINYQKLIEMQANQQSFAPRQSIGASIKAENTRTNRQKATKVNQMNKAKVKVYGKSGKYGSLVLIFCRKEYIWLTLMILKME